MTPNVLLFGDVAELLTSRTTLLSQHDFNVLDVSDLPTDPMLKRVHIHLAVLCFSLSPRGQRLAIMTTRSYSPTAKILLLMTRQRPDVRFPFTGMTVLRDEEDLVARAFDLTSRVRSLKGQLSSVQTKGYRTRVSRHLAMSVDQMSS